MKKEEFRLNLRRWILGTLAILGIAVTVAPPSFGHIASPTPLRVCVDGYATNPDLSGARGRLERVIRTHVATHPRFAAAGYQPGLLTVVEGCPVGPALLLSGAKHPKNGGAPGLAGLTSVPTGIRAFIFVVPDSEINRMFGSLSYSTASQEITCSTSDHCGEVSTAFYISHGLLLDSESASGEAALAKGLLEAVGLELPFPLPEPRVPQRK